MSFTSDAVPALALAPKHTCPKRPFRPVTPEPERGAA